jgi:DNA-binding FrmR family transcriptional regulator
MINEEVKRKSLERLRKIEGQIRGIQKMIERESYCIDIITQLSAVESALKQVSLIIMKRHLESCVTEAMKSGKKEDKETKINELMEVFERFSK